MLYPGSIIFISNANFSCTLVSQFLKTLYIISIDVEILLLFRLRDGYMMFLAIIDKNSCYYQKPRYTLESAVVKVFCRPWCWFIADADHRQYYAPTGREIPDHRICLVRRKQFQNSKQLKITVDLLFYNKSSNIKIYFYFIQYLLYSIFIFIK